MQKPCIFLLTAGDNADNTICVENEEGKKLFLVESLRDIFVFGEVDLKKLLEFLKSRSRSFTLATMALMGTFTLNTTIPAM